LINLSIQLNVLQIDLFGGIKLTSQKTIKNFMLCLGLCLIAVIYISNLQAEDWTQWRGINRDGISNEKELLKEWQAEGPKLLWSVSDIGAGFSSPSISNEIIYVTGMKDNKELLLGIIGDQRLLSRTLEKL